MNNNIPCPTIKQEFDFFHVVVESNYAPGKTLIVCLTDQLDSFDEAKRCLKFLQCDFPKAKIRAEKFY